MKLTVSTLSVCMLALTFLPIGRAQGSDPNDIEALKAKLAEQQSNSRCFANRSTPGKR